ncbi:alpha-galactosidase [Microbacterium sp. AK009]|uniref:alpha-galactosidase n=1 Tax=Microbacterium sp. AK009 TaxID=2723068 RepID=UPI0015CCC6F7|nr:alpha-galactosidase [Microbacterium sp. AK009]NYF16025.1 alpha-galactosidase [Microbacterium sp. AK009]
MTSSIKLHDEQKVDDDVDSLPRHHRGTPIHISNGGVSVVFGFDTFGLPTVMHWGRALSDKDVPSLVASSDPAIMNSSVDIPRSFSIAAGRAHGWSGTPAIEAMIGEESVVEFLELRGVEHDRKRLRFDFGSGTGEVDLRAEYRLDPAGVLHVQTRLKNNSALEIVRVAASRMLMPLPDRAREMLDFTGRWTHERHPQRSGIRDGTWLRASRRGRPGHDSPFLTIAGTQGFRFRAGEVWATHLAWSGNQEVIVERLPEGAGVHRVTMGGGELLDQGEVRLSPGQSYDSPPALFAWSDEGIDGMTERFHRSIRARTQHPVSPRPLLLNTWEAVYFDHDVDKLIVLAETASQVGVERFVLDDGWFRGRRQDTAGLGDWYVDEAIWPAGLRPLSQRVHELGMEFGLWFEPEMVNLDSDLARAHPDWLLSEDPRLESRHQFVLDFSRPDVRTYVLDRVNDVLDAAGVDYIKWDHNRDLHAALGQRGNRAVHAHTQGVYEVLREIKRRHPRVEIETCASGGGRIDFGILSYTDRVWASDSNDPVERQQIQRWTQALLPPELIGAHIGPTQAHTTRRSAPFSFRAITALFGHAGLEWDLSAITPKERENVAAFAALYKELRPLLHSGTTVRADEVDDGAILHGIVAEEQREAVFAWVRVSTSATAQTTRVPVPGLNPDLTYRVRVRDEVGDASRHEVADPSWVRVPDGFLCTGAVLAEGLPLPVLNPGHGMLFHITEAA